MSHIPHERRHAFSTPVRGYGECWKTPYLSSPKAGGSMVLISRLPGYRTAQPGLERKILRLLPPALTIGLAVLMMPSVLLRILPLNMHPVALDMRIAKADIY